MYRVHFVFDIAELRRLAKPALVAFLERRGLDPEVWSERFFLLWLRHCLKRLTYLLVEDHPQDTLRELLDSTFWAEITTAEPELYRLIARAVYPNAHPCLESRCRVRVFTNDLWLDFHV